MPAPNYRRVPLAMKYGYLTPKQVATYLAVTDRTVRNLISDGALLAIQVGRAWRIRKDWLEDYERRLVTGARGRTKRVFVPIVEQAFPAKPDEPAIRKRRA